MTYIKREGDKWKERGRQIERERETDRKRDTVQLNMRDGEKSELNTDKRN